MNNNIIVNNSDVAKVIKIVKYVNITFSTNPSNPQKLIPGSYFRDFLPLNVVEFDYNSDHRNYYKTVYDWKNNNVSIPLLVPNTNKTYIADYCEFDFSDLDAVINYSQTGQQTMARVYEVYSDEPLYFTATTTEGNETKEVYVNATCSLNSNRYKYSLSFYVSDVSVVPGTPKTYTTIISLFKDYNCSKYLGEVQIEIIVVSSAGPGE
ncbi:MAG: hypothetical protein J6Y42_01770 [Bacilli bacterium]|nr:hypothetical protein [Bacilli bacterium]